MTKPLDILFITDALTEPLYGRRTRYFCDFFHRRGHNVRLITERYKPLPFHDGFETIEIPYYIYTHGLPAKTEWAVKNILSFFFDYRNRFFSRKISELERTRHPDIVVVSTFYTMGLRAAARLAREHRIPFVVDLRDIAEQCTVNTYERASSATNPLARWMLHLYRAVNVGRRNRVLRRADAVVGVTPWTVEVLKKYNNNTHLVYNGFDDKVFRFEAATTGKFKITYSGKWYGQEMQDPHLLFKALSLLKTTQPALYADIEMEWYTDPASHKPLLDMAARYSVAGCMSMHGYLPFAEVPAMLHRSSIQLVLTAPISANVLPTKLFEAIGVEKPVACVRCAPGALAHTIHSAHAGIATESAGELAQFIADQHAIWKSHGFTHQHTDNNHYFSRSNQALRLENIINEVINNYHLSNQ